MGCTMNRKLIFQIIVLILLSCKTILIFAGAKKDHHAYPLYTEDHQNIMVKKSQACFALKLKSNPSTGYSWFLRDYDSLILHPIHHQYETPKKQLIGASGNEQWTFCVKSKAFIVPQQTIIRMIYARPFEGAESTTQLVFRISVLS